MPLQVAQKRPLNDETLRDQLGRLGGTGYALAALENQLEGAVIVPVSELNRLRRDLVKKLGAAPSAAEAAPVRVMHAVESRLARIAGEGSLDRNNTINGIGEAASVARAVRAENGGAPAEATALTVLCRTMEQIDVALRLGVGELYADFEDIRRYKDAAARVRETAARLYLATPRIQKAGEAGFFQLIENARPDGVLIRNLGALDHFRGGGLRRIGDFSLNVANPLTAEALMGEGLDRLTVFLRSQRGAGARPAARRAARVVRADAAPAHPDVPHGALRLCRVFVGGDRSHQLRPALRPARREAARPRGAGASAQGRRGVAATRSSTRRRNRARPTSRNSSR